MRLRLRVVARPGCDTVRSIRLYSPFWHHLTAAASSSMSLHQIFNGGYLATTGDLADWRALAGYGYSQNCNRQGFNIQGQPTGSGWQRDARIGIFFNNENDCNSPDAGRNIGASSASAVVGCIYCDTGISTAYTSDVWVRISVLMPVSDLPDVNSSEAALTSDGSSAAGIVGGVAGLVVGGLFGAAFAIWRWKKGKRGHVSHSARPKARPRDPSSAPSVGEEARIRVPLTRAHPREGSSQWSDAAMSSP